MLTPHPTRTVQFTLLATLLGIAIPFAVESMVNKYSLPVLIATTAFLLTSINFFHAKVVTLEDDDHNRALIDRPALALADYVLNMLVVLSLVFMAFFLDKPGPLVIANLVVRTVDIPLVLLVLSISTKKDIRKAQLYWLIINLLSIVYWLFLLLILQPVEEYPLVISAAFLALIMLDITIDYSVNWKMYFSVAVSWDDDELAVFWDQLQGEEGDVYRRCIIVPALKKICGDIQGKRILDLGCGNGCVARHLAKAGAFVVAVDRSMAMIQVAQKYGHPDVTYVQIDIERNQDAIENGDFDVVIACFTLQDCKTLSSLFQLIARNLSSNGRAIVIFENEYAFESLHEHITTRRRWIDPPRLTGKGRRQLIFWERGTKDAALSSRSFATITRHWSEERYLEYARAEGLNPITMPEDLYVLNCENDADKMMLLGYMRRPRFRIIVLTKT